MKLFKAIRYDLRFGILESMKKYLFVVLLAMFIFAGLIIDAVTLSVALTETVDNVFKLPISFADVILIELGANLPVALKSTGVTGFTFPTMWFLCIYERRFGTAADAVRNGGSSAFFLAGFWSGNFQYCPDGHWRAVG